MEDKKYSLYSYLDKGSVKYAIVEADKLPEGYQTVLLTGNIEICRRRLYELESF